MLFCSQVNGQIAITFYKTESPFVRLYDHISKAVVRQVVYHRAAAVSIIRSGIF